MLFRSSVHVNETHQLTTDDGASIEVGGTSRVNVTGGTGGAYGEDGWGFSGFTAATTKGSIAGGRTGIHALCAADFPGSHLCHAAEYLRSNSTLDPPAAGAWLDPSEEAGKGPVYSGGPQSGRYPFSPSCNSWSTDLNAYAGTWVTPTGGISTSGGCDVPRALACCGTPAKVRLAGFTGMTKGNGGGRQKLHALCDAAFAGSRLCHAAEYLRANSPLAPPASGAWLDPSTSTGTSTNNAGMPGSGRWIYSSDCIDWTSAAAGTYGYWVSAAGDITTDSNCSASRALACCL